MTDPKLRRVFNYTLREIHKAYLHKVERKGRTRAELDQVLCWLAGLDPSALQAHLDQGTTLEGFFAATQLHPGAAAITGVVCGVRVETVEDPLMKKIRIMDKVVDELARGKALAKILREAP